MKKKMIVILSIVISILFLPTGMSAETTLPIDITFSPGGMGKTVESVKVTNLSRMDVEPQTLRGTDILRLGKAQLKGDVNGDGNVDISDIVAVINTIAGKITYKESGDVNNDKNIDISDIVAIINIIAGGDTKSSSPRHIKSNVEPTYFTSEESPFTAAFIRSKAKATNIVEMDFKEGDILRFEGVSGEMRTIVVNAPKRSHSISFYFYPCKDASGNTYPIIEAGGLLWMAEDLKAINNVKDVYFYENYESSQWASASNAKKTSSMAMIMSDDDVYYTYSAARLALPEGWSLPTLGELEAVSINLGGFEAACDKMKRAGDIYSFRDRRRTNPDSLQLRINPKGYVNRNGEVTDTDNGYILTGTREKQKAVYMTLSSSGGSVSDIITPNGLDSYAAVHVRGVRPAPSAYTDMMSQLYSNSATKSRMNMPKKAAEEESDDTNLYTGEVNPYTGTPYGQYYSVDHSTKQIVLDVTGQKCMGWVSVNDSYVPFGLNESYFGTVFVNASDGSISQKLADGDWIKNNKGERMNRTRLKKMCQQKTADGTYKTLKLSYSVIAHDYQNDGSTDSHWMARDIEDKEGELNLEIFGNESTDFRLENSMTLPGTYKMAKFDGFVDGYTWSEDLRVDEFYMKRINLLAADFNNDCVDDIVVGFCEKWIVLDGTDYKTVLAEQIFPTDCVRACVGDYNENGYSDLGLIYQQNNQIEVRVLLDDIKKFDARDGGSGLNDVSDYSGSLPQTGKPGISTFLDIKFGDITNTGNSILCFIVPNRHIQLNEKSAFYVLQPNAKNTLDIKYKFEEEQKYHLSNEWSDYSSTNTNSTIAVVHTRGLGERPDVLLRNGLYRINEQNEFEQVNIGGDKEDGLLLDAAIMSDCVAVGRFTDDLKEGYEQLAYFGTRIVHQHSKKWNSSAGDIYSREIFGYTELLTPGFSGEKSTGQMTRKVLNSGSIGSVCWWTKDGDYHFGAVFPAFCATSYKDIDTRRYKFVSCNATMSEPRIKFALAAAPYWANVPAGYANAGEPYDYGDNGPSTEWVTSTSTTEATENSNGTSASLIFGYEQENKVSVFGVEIGKYGFEFETNIGYEWEKSYSEANTYTFESGCSAGRDNKVGLTMTPVWLYTYECIESNDPDNIGTTLVCGAPSYPRDLELSETDYMLLRGDREDIPDLSTVFTHTPGNPLTYPNSPDLIKSTGNILWSNNNKDQYSTTGSDGTKSFSITVDRENSTTTSNTFSMDMSLVGFVGAFNHTVKAGFGVGYSHTWSNTYSTGYGTTVTGSVPLPKSWGDVPIFDWNMCRYSVEVGGQEFPVVNYIVKNVRKSANGK